MSASNPILRDDRERIAEAAAGQVVFGPFSFILHDGADVAVSVKEPDWDEYLILTAGAFTGEEEIAGDFAPAPASPATVFPALFTIRLAAARPEGTLVRVRGARVHERETDVTQGRVVNSVLLEAELDRQTAVLQELRRDVDTAIAPVEGLADAVAAAQAARDIAAAAEAAAEAARDLAIDAAGESLLNFRTKATAAAADLTAVPTGTVVNILAWDSAGKGGHRGQIVAAAPAHEAWFLLADGRWLENIERELTPEMYGWTGGATASAGNTAAFQKWARNQAGRGTMLEPHSYPLTGRADPPANSHWRGVKGRSKVAAAAGGVFADDVMVQALQALIALPALAGSIAKGALQCVLASAPTLNVDDYLLIWDTDDYSFGQRSYYRAGELLRVRAVDGATVHFCSMARASYATGAARRIYRLPKGAFTCEGVEFDTRDHASEPMALRVSGMTQVALRDLAAGNDSYTCVRIDRCANVLVDNPVVTCNGSLAGNEFALIIGSCQGVTVRGGFMGAARHGAATGDTSEDGGIPLRDIVYEDAVISSWDTVHGTDNHGHTENIVHRNCTHLNGVQVGGRDQAFEGGRIIGGIANDGALMFASEPIGGTFSFRNMVWETLGNPVFGLAVIGTAGHVGAHLRDEATFIFEQITVRAPNFAGQMVRMHNNLGDVALNAIVNDIYLEAPDIDRILDARYIGDKPWVSANTYSVGDRITHGGLFYEADEDHTAGTFATDLAAGKWHEIADPTTPSRVIAIDHIYGLPAGAAYATFEGGIYDAAATELIMPEQAGTLAMALASGTSPQVAAVTFPHAYPVEPICTVNLRNTDPYVGTDAIHVAINSLTEAALTVVAYTAKDANFAAISLPVHWTARLR